MDESPTFMDFFAGAGGLSLGLVHAGLQPLWAFDMNPLACETHRSNIAECHVDALSMDDINFRKIVLQHGVPDVIVGGPPCQGFSTKGSGHSSDPRNRLVVEYIKNAVSIGPKIIVMENVPGVLGVRGKALVTQAREILADAGYVVATRIVQAVSVGVPQYRKRAILVAQKRDLDDFVFSAFDKPNEIRTVRDAIGHLPSPPEDGSPHPYFANHSRAKISPINIERISHVPPGGGRLDLPEHLQLACHRANTSRHHDVYGRLEWDKPAPTITAMFDNFTRGRFAHPDENRNITNREGASIQTFPEDYHFVGPKKEVAKQIGNAVPPKVGQAIGSEIMQILGLQGVLPTAC